MEAEIRKGGKKRGDSRGGERSEEGDSEGHAGDEGEELVMVMRRCNDSSAVRSELALSFPSLFLLFFSLSFSLRSTLYLRSAFVRR